MLTSSLLKNTNKNLSNRGLWEEQCKNGYLHKIAGHTQEGSRRCLGSMHVGDKVKRSDKAWKGIVIRLKVEAFESYHE
ncbi:hypothetical protein Tco_1300468 [Tanacetum coccineum]